jgi:hypothetical protein
MNNSKSPPINQFLEGSRELESSMKEGDFYRWRYSDKARKQYQHKIDAGTLYWCKSQISRFNGTYLIDTFWSSGSSNDRVKINSDIEFSFIANESDLENISEYNQDKYNPRDIVNLNHSNSSRGNLYIRKGATECRETKNANLVREIEDLKQDIVFKKTLIRLKELELKGDS